MSRFEGFSTPEAAKSRAERTSKAHDTPNYELELKELEQQFLFSQMEEPYLRQRRTEIAEKFPGQSESMAYALEGALHHEKAEGEHRLFLLHEADTIKKSLKDTTREDVQAAYASFPEKIHLEREEQEALELYEAGTKRAWKGTFLEPNDIRALKADIETRRASRLADPKARAAAYAETDREYQRIVEWTNDPGKKLEYKLLYLLQQWVREADKEHVIEFRHALPREDMAEATDAVLTLGAEQFNLQQKALSSDAYRAEHTEKVLQKAGRRTAEKGSILFVVEPRDVHDAYGFATSPESELSKGDKNRRTRLKRQLIGLVSSVTSPELESLLLGVEETPESADKPPSGKKITPKFLEQNSSVSQMVRIGLLSETEARDPMRLMAAKRNLKERAKELQKIFPTQEAWLEPTSEAVVQVRDLFGESDLATAAE